MVTIWVAMNEVARTTAGHKVAERLEVVADLLDLEMGSGIFGPPHLAEPLRMITANILPVA
jgi:hypothetical protein